MRFVEVSTIEPNVLQEWHCGEFSLTARMTGAPDRFKVQLRHGKEVIRPEFLLTEKSRARLAARFLLQVLTDLVSPTREVIDRVLRSFAFEHGWHQWDIGPLEPLRSTIDPRKTRILKRAEAMNAGLCQLPEFGRRRQ